MSANNTGLQGRRNAIFNTLKFFIQYQGVSEEDRRSLAEILIQHGAQPVQSPIAPDCKVIFAFPATHPSLGEYKVIEGRARSLEACRSGPATAWTLDDICTHLARKEGDQLQKRYVLGAGWVKECMQNNKSIRYPRWGCWEIVRSVPKTKVAPAMPVERAADRMSIPASLPTNDTAPAVVQGSLDGRQGSGPAVHTCRAELENKTAQPTQKSTPGKMFHTFAHDPYGVRNFHVVEGSIKWPYERLIKGEGGTIADIENATFIIFDTHPAVLDHDLVRRLQKTQIALSADWVKHSVGLKAIQNVDNYRVLVPDAERYRPDACRFPTPGSSVPPVKQESSPSRGSSPSEPESPANSDQGEVAPHDIEENPGENVVANPNQALPDTRIQQSVEGDAIGSAKRPRVDQEDEDMEFDPDADRASPTTPTEVDSALGSSTDPPAWKKKKRPPPNSVAGCMPASAQSSTPTILQSRPGSPSKRPTAGRIPVEELIRDLDVWCRKGNPGKRTTLLKQLNREKGGHERVSLFKRQRDYILSALESLGHDTSVGSRLSGSNVQSYRRARKSGPGCASEAAG